MHNNDEIEQTHICMISFNFIFYIVTFHFEQEHRLKYIKCAGAN